MTKTKPSHFKLSASAVALCATSAIASSAIAQEEAAAAASSLDVIVVTASGGDRSQIASSIAATQISDDTVQDFQPTTDTELFRLLPGIQTAGTVGPGGNGNIAVRGLAVATGGGPFVQIQEDGLPTVLFGDIQFGNNDYWTKFDATTKAVEAVRGGTVSTFASQAPGAVINYISHTGEEEGGYIQLRRGLGFDETQVDFRYGAPINDLLRFHVGGFFRTGEGPLETGQRSTESIQIKANTTYDLPSDDGYFRLLFKFADTREPNYAGAPALVDFDGSSVSNVEPFPGFDGRDQLNNSNLIQQMLILDREGDLVSVPIDGITTEQFSIGGEFFYEFDSGFTIDNKMRWSDISGGFAENFVGIARTDSVIGSELSLNGVPYATVDEIRYANGPLAGQVYTDTYLDNNAMFRTNIRDLGSFVNDLKITGEFDTDFAQITARVGYFYMSQDIVIDWQVNRNNRELSGDNAALLDLFDAGGNQLTHMGISGFNNNWGDCCSRDYDLNYTNQAPYFGLDLDMGSIIIDGSVRYDSVDATGFTIGPGDEFLIDVNGIMIPAIAPTVPNEVLDYNEDYVSWTAGALYRVTDDLSVFGRAAKGNRFNADRQTFSGKINADGSLNDSGLAAAVDQVKQYEIGLKNRGDLGGGFYTAELTLFMADFAQSTFEISPIICGAAGTCIVDAEFESKGIEFFGTYNVGDLSFVANATYSDAERKAAGETEFSAAQNIPDLTYTLSANYDIAEVASAGLSVSGQTGFPDPAGVEWPGNALVSGVVKFYPLENVEIGLDVYNLFDSYVVRTEGGVIDSSVSPAVAFTPLSPGRTFRARARYNF